MLENWLRHEVKGQTYHPARETKISIVNSHSPQMWQPESDECLSLNNLENAKNFVLIKNVITLGRIALCEERKGLILNTTSTIVKDGTS